MVARDLSLPSYFAQQGEYSIFPISLESFVGGPSETEGVAVENAFVAVAGSDTTQKRCGVVSFIVVASSSRLLDDWEFFWFGLLFRFFNLVRFSFDMSREPLQTNE